MLPRCANPGGGPAVVPVLVGGGVVHRAGGGVQTSAGGAHMSEGAGGPREDVETGGPPEEKNGSHRLGT